MRPMQTRHIGFLGEVVSISVHLVIYRFLLGQTFLVDNALI